MQKWNHYKCQQCGSVTIARHDDEGVTPFMIRCRAKDTIGFGGCIGPGCSGMAESAFFNCPQNDNQKPHVVFFRPEAKEALAWINGQPKKDRAWLLDHYQKGGSLMRDVLSEPHKL